MKLLEVTLKGLPPTVNQMYRNAGTSRRYKTQKTLSYQAHAVKVMKSAQGFPTYEGNILLNVNLYAPNNRKWDLDNRLKVLQDCLQMAKIIKDDSQIRKLTAERIDYAGEPYTTVAVYTMEDKA